MKTQLLKITIPPGLDFGDLKMSRIPETGEVEFDWTPIERLCEQNGLDVEIFRDSDEENVAGLINSWYFAHLENGGARDPVQDDLIAEAMAEDEHGGGFSLPPGRA
jgi:hypothetical protein